MEWTQVVLLGKPTLHSEVQAFDGSLTHLTFVWAVLAYSFETRL